MMHHPNLHHQTMSGHPPQHLAAHQAMPGHHQLPPHQMHRENRHVPLHRLAMGPSQASGSLGGPALGGLGALGVRPPHAVRGLHHGPPPPAPGLASGPPPQQHHSLPQAMKPMGRGYIGGGFGGGGGPGVLPAPYAPHHAPPPPHTPHTQPRPPQPPQRIANGISTSSSTLPSKNSSSTAVDVPAPAMDTTSGGVTVSAGEGPSEEGRGESGGGTGAGAGTSAGPEPGDAEAARPAPPTLANSKEKTPMCLVNELARYNKIKHQYRLTSETGPAHKKIFTVTLRLGDTEEYTAEGSSIKRAQHAAASAALSQTRYGAPPPRTHPPHAHASAHHRHSGAVMPTVELNALAMKLCQPAVYTAMPPVPAPARYPRARPPPPPHPHAPYRPHAPFMPHLHPQRMLGPGLVYRVRVSVGGRAWLGEGPTPQAARHDAAARALHDLRSTALTDRPGAIIAADATAAAAAPTATATAADDDNAEGCVDSLSSEVKSPVSLVHELALKQGLPVTFTVKSERGPPHMRVFVTACAVGDMETEGEGNGKKVSKRRAAERMLEEMRRRWPAALVRARPPPAAKRKPQPPKKKTRNLIKESVESVGGGGDGGGGEAADNPISRLAMARHAARARSPQYRVLEERGAARRREFVVQCDAPPHHATGLGPNKKTAKRRAAHNVLLAMELAGQNADGTKPNTNAVDPSNETDNKRKENEPSGANACSEGRQPVPGVLLMDYQQRAHTAPPHTAPPHTAPPHNGVTDSQSSSSAANAGCGTTGASNGTNTPGAKDQLMYLSHLLGFTVQFSDFPKRNHGEYLSLVSLSTEPPVMCHGGGPSTAQSHEQCSRAALRALALMGLDAPTDRMQGAPGSGPKPGALSNGVTE